MKKIIIIVGVVLLLSAGGAAAYFFIVQETPVASDTEEAALPEPEEEVVPIFLKLSPPIVVNFSHRGDLRFLQTTLELMHPDQDVIDDVTLRMPVIRNNLILFFSDQTFESLSSKTAKEDLRVKISESISEIVQAQPPVEIYITSFIMQ